MSGPLSFRQLVVRRMPGFPGGGLRLDELSPGINLVHGPNASGKTTAARALQSLLWSRTAPADAGLEGRFELDGASWSVRVESRRPSWQREGQDAPAPPLPPADDRDRYLLSLHGLLADDDRGLAERIRVESAGGYDVRAAEESLGFGAGGRPRSLLEARTAAAAGLEEARSREAELRDDAVELARLRDRRDDLERALVRLEPLRRALTLARARDSESASGRALEAFPAVMGRLRGDELERLEEWDEASRACDIVVAEAEAAATAASAALDDAGPREDGVPAAVVSEAEAKLEALRRLDDDHARARDAHSGARGRRDRAAASLGIEADGDGAVDPADLPADPPADPTVDITTVDVDRLDRLILSAGRLRERRAALEQRLQVLGVDAADGPVPGAATDSPSAGADAAADATDADAAAADDAADADRAEAIRVLRQWLRSGDAGSDDGGRERRLRTLALVAIAALGVTGLAAAVAGAGSVQAAGVALLVLGVVLSVLLATAPARATGRARDVLEQQARRLGHEPARWSVDAVETLLDVLERRAAAEQVAAERRQEAERVARDLPALEAEEAALAEERAAVADSLGLSSPPGDLTLHVLASRIRQWDEARTAEAGEAAVLEDIESRRADVVAAAARLVSPYGYAVGDADGLASALQDLRSRRERHQTATTALAAARRDRDRGVRERDDISRRRSELFDRLGLTEDQAGDLRGWIDQLEAYQAARSELELAERKRAEAEAALADLPADAGAHPPAAPDAPDAPDAPAAPDAPDAPDAAPVAVLEEELERLEAAAVDERELSARVAGIEARLEDARRKHDVEEALARVAAADAALADKRDEDVEAEVGAALVDWLGERASDHNRPAVFHEARELFGLITRGRYRLDIDDGDAVAFRAYDNTTHRGHGLDELSSGTRLQLLLAVRMAFVETQETGAALPLLLDEVLANCDDDRASAIIDAALALAAAGRQIFYFTAQADELVKWRSRLEAQHEVDWCVRHVLDGTADARDVEWPEVIRAEVPAPDGLDHAAYGRALRVPPFDPWADGVGGLHLWYLVDDVDALYGLLTLGIEQWGQLEYLANGGHGVPGTSGEVIDDARRAAELCNRFRQLWRQGRGRPVSRAVLEASGAVSDTFIDRVADLCDEVGGDGAALVEALAGGRVPRFQAAKTEELRAFLQAGSYLSHDEPLAPAKVRVILLSGAAGADPTAVDSLLDRLVRGPQPA